MKMTRALLVFLFLILWTAIAHAADPNSPTSQVAVGAAALLFAVLTPIAIALGALAAQKIKSATRVDLTKQIQIATAQAIGYAEQLARRRVAEGASKLPGGAKLDLALRFLVPLAEEQGWPLWARERATEWIEAELGQGAKLFELAGPAPAKDEEGKTP